MIRGNGKNAGAHCAPLRLSMNTGKFANEMIRGNGKKAGAHCAPLRCKQLIVIGELVQAEREGFEPPVGCPTPVFKTGTIGRSVISPVGLASKNFIISTHNEQDASIDTPSVYIFILKIHNFAI